MNAYKDAATAVNDAYDRQEAILSNHSEFVSFSVWEMRALVWLKAMLMTASTEAKWNRGWRRSLTTFTSKDTEYISRTITGDTPASSSTTPSFRCQWGSGAGLTSPGFPTGTHIASFKFSVSATADAALQPAAVGSEAASCG